MAKADDPDSGHAAPAQPHESLGSAPPPIETTGSAPSHGPEGSGPEAPGGGTFGNAPGSGETGRTPEPANTSENKPSVPVLVGGGVVLLALIALIIGLVAR
jgi:hypothetical protein